MRQDNIPSNTMAGLAMSARSMLRQARCPECHYNGMQGGTGKCNWCRERAALMTAILGGPDEQPTPSETEAPHAMKSLTDALHADPEYAWAWHCNLAMPIMDCLKVSHEAANDAGAALMQHLFRIDMRQHQHWQFGPTPSKAAAPQPDGNCPAVDVPHKFASETTERATKGRCIYCGTPDNQLHDDSCPLPYAENGGEG